MQIDFLKLPDTVAIIGSRSFEDDKVGSIVMLNEVYRFINRLDKGTQIVSGGAKGVDEWGARAAAFYQMPLAIIFWPRKELPSPQRFFARNAEIVKHIREHTGVVVAFADVGNYRGTRNTLNTANKQGVPTLILFYTRSGQYVSKECNKEFEQYVRP